jgi:hypothetical protein
MTERNTVAKARASPVPFASAALKGRSSTAMQASVNGVECSHSSLLRITAPLAFYMTGYVEPTLSPWRA